MIRIQCLLALSIFFSFTVNGQLISKQEAEKINALLNEFTQQNKPGSYVFRNATVITMKDSIVHTECDVWIESSTIKKIGKDISVDPSVEEIDATGKFIMPGLTDMHAHLFLQHPLTNTWILHLLLSGVTTIRDMNGDEAKLSFRDRIARNDILAPTIYQASKLTDSRKDKFFQQVSTPEEAKRLVIKMKQAGYDFIKVYDGLKKDVYQALTEEAQRHGMLVVGHVPDAVTIDQALASHQHSIEHLTGYFEWKGPVIHVTAPPDFASLTAQSQTWNCPTIYNHYLNGSREGTAEVLRDPVSALIPKDLYELWSKRQTGTSKEVIEIVDKHGASNFEALKKILTGLYHAKAKLVAGTDAGNLPFLIPGHALYKELELLSEMAITRHDVLKMATCNASQAMGKSNDFGTVEEGKRADLLLLDTNPLEDLNSLNKNKGIMIRGIWISPEERAGIAAKMKAIFGN